jgi:Flp pilus assembly pilin Flp
MIRGTNIAYLRRTCGGFWVDESGASLVEFGLVITLFLFLLLAIVDFGRIGHAWVGANKATQLAARIAAVRPPACAGLPLLNLRGTAASPPAFGALCRAGAGVCANPGTISCQGSATNSTALEIFTAVRPLIPAGTTIGQMRYSYSFDANLGFLGGPYVPMVTVELTSVNFTFITQLGAFVPALAGQSSTLGTPLRLPGMSVSLPGEDLALGMDG